MSLLNCSVCGSELKVYGKQGAVLHTNCSNCGSDSGPMITMDTNRKPIQKPVRANVEVIHRRAARREASNY